MCWVVPVWTALTLFLRHPQAFGTLYVFQLDDLAVQVITNQGLHKHAALPDPASIQRSNTDHLKLKIECQAGSSLGLSITLVVHLAPAVA